MKNLMKNTGLINLVNGKRVKCCGFASKDADYFFIMFTDDTVLLLEAGMDGTDEEELATIEVKTHCDLSDEQILCINKAVEDEREGCGTGWESALTNSICDNRYFSR